MLIVVFSHRLCMLLSHTVDSMHCICPHLSNKAGLGATLSLAQQHNLTIVIKKLFYVLVIDSCISSKTQQIVWLQ